MFQDTVYNNMKGRNAIYNMQYRKLSLVCIIFLSSNSNGAQSLWPPHHYQLQYELEATVVTAYCILSASSPLVSRDLNFPRPDLLLLIIVVKIFVVVDGLDRVSEQLTNILQGLHPCLILH